MNQKTYLITAAIIFLVVGVLHLLRAIFSLTLVAGSYQIPVWASYVFGVIILILSYKGFKLSKNSEK